MKYKLNNNFADYLEYRVKELKKENKPICMDRLKKNFLSYQKRMNTKEVITKSKPKNNHYLTKTEAYNTEQEMINGYIAPRYWELSKEEKKIFNSL